jgi:hypothetical protein
MIGLIVPGLRRSLSSITFRAHIHTHTHTYTHIIIIYDLCAPPWRDCHHSPYGRVSHPLLPFPRTHTHLPAACTHTHTHYCRSFFGVSGAGLLPHSFKPGKWSSSPIVMRTTHTYRHYCDTSLLVHHQYHTQILRVRSAMAIATVPVARGGRHP